MDLSRRLEQFAQQLAHQDAVFAEFMASSRDAEHEVIVRAERVAELSNLVDPKPQPSLPTRFVRI